MCKWVYNSVRLSLNSNVKERLRRSTSSHLCACMYMFKGDVWRIKSVGMNIQPIGTHLGQNIRVQLPGTILRVPKEDQNVVQESCHGSLFYRLLAKPAVKFPPETRGQLEPFCVIIMSKLKIGAFSSTHSGLKGSKLRSRLGILGA